MLALSLKVLLVKPENDYGNFDVACAKVVKGCACRFWAICAIMANFCGFCACAKRWDFSSCLCLLFEKNLLYTGLGGRDWTLKSGVWAVRLAERRGYAAKFITRVVATFARLLAKLAIVKK